MFELLKAYLDMTVTPEQSALCIDACNALVECGVTAHHFSIEQELAIAEQADGDVFLSVVNRVVLPLFHQCFNELGLIVDPSATLADCTDLLRAMDGLDNYEDADTIVGLCEAEQGAVDSLAELLALTGQHDAEHYLGLLLYVNGDLLEKLSAEYEDKTSEEPVLDSRYGGADHEAIKARLIKFLQLPGLQAGTEPLVSLALQDSMPLGLHIHELLAPYKDRLAIMEPADMGRELVGLLLASRTPDAFETLRNSAGIAATELCEDLHQITAVDVAATKLLKQVYDA